MNLNDLNFKLTAARKKLLDIFSKASKPLCYEDVKDDISMDKATFYRNISKFEEENIINSFEANDKKRYYELRRAPHAHFICTKCNNVECVNEPVNIKLDNHIIENIIIKGKCPACIV